MEAESCLRRSRAAPHIVLFYVEKSLYPSVSFPQPSYVLFVPSSLLGPLALLTYIILTTATAHVLPYIYTYTHMM